MRYVLVVAFAAVVAVGLTSGAQAGLINSTFECPALGDGGTSEDLGGWNWSTWAGATQNAVIINPTASMFTGAGGDSGPLPSPAGGAQCLAVTPEANAAVWQLVATVQPNNTYMISADVGTALDEYATGSVNIYFTDGASILGDLNVATVGSEGTFAHNTFSWDSGAWSGNELRAAVYYGDGAGRVMIDNIVVFLPYPEPSTALMLVIGAMGLLAYAWRKRR